MNAIDFATRLTANLLHTPNHTPIQNGILLALAAGLDCATDIATTLHTTPSTTALNLHRLAKIGHCQAQNYLEDGTPLYTLTPTGRQHIRHNLINFLH